MAIEWKCDPKCSFFDAISCCSLMLYWTYPKIVDISTLPWRGCELAESNMLIWVFLLTGKTSCPRSYKSINNSEMMVFLRPMLFHNSWTQISIIDNNLDYYKKHCKTHVFEQGTLAEFRGKLLLLLKATVWKNTSSNVVENQSGWDIWATEHEAVFGCSQMSGSQRTVLSGVILMMWYGPSRPTSLTVKSSANMGRSRTLVPQQAAKNALHVA